MPRGFFDRLEGFRCKNRKKIYAVLNQQSQNVKEVKRRKKEIHLDDFWNSKGESKKTHKKMIFKFPKEISVQLFQKKKMVTKHEKEVFE